MRKRGLQIALWSGLIATVAVVAVGGWGGQAAAQEPAEEGIRIAALVREMETMSAERLEALPPLPIGRWELPAAGVDVMRARLEESYVIDGIGEDTVELTGWIAVRHSDPRPAPGEQVLTWNTAVVDTVFVGMHLRGESELFGPVEVRLAPGERPRGQVGRIAIPEGATTVLAQVTQPPSGQPPRRPPVRESAPVFRVDGTRSIRRDVPAPKQIAPEVLKAPEADFFQAAPCEAPVAVQINLSALDLELITEEPTVWYSLVDTIPPVGETASITVRPVGLLSNGRRVGTLKSGIVTFRELVRHVELTSDRDRLARRGR